MNKRKGNTRLNLMVALMFALATELATASANPRIIQNEAGAAQLSVGGKPFLIIGGELHNSSSSGIGYFAEALDDTASLGEYENGRLRRVLNGDEGGNDVFLARGIARRTNERNEEYEKASADSYVPQTFRSIHLPAEYRVRFYRRKNTMGTVLNTFRKSGNEGE